MADLPDLDKSTIGIIGFWNALDNGAGDVHPMEATEYDFLESYQQYDNGIEGTVRFNFANKQRTYGFRVKTDGWHMVWVDQTNEYQTRQTSPSTDGYYDILNDWTDSGESSTVPDSVLSKLITDIANFTAPDGIISTIGYYCFEYESANAIWNATQYQNNSDRNWREGGVSYTDDVFRYHHSMTARTRDEAAVKLEDTKIAGNLYNNNGDEWGAFDVANSSLMDSSGEVIHNALNTDYDWCKADHLALFEI